MNKKQFRFYLEEFLATVGFIGMTVFFLYGLPMIIEWLE